MKMRDVSFDSGGGFRVPVFVSRLLVCLGGRKNPRLFRFVLLKAAVVEPAETAIMNENCKTKSAFKIVAEILRMSFFCSGFSLRYKSRGLGLVYEFCVAKLTTFYTVGKVEALFTV